jgi:hypothetical protein
VIAIMSQKFRPCRRRPWVPRRLRAIVGLAATVSTVVLAVPGRAWAAPDDPRLLAVNDLPTVIANLQGWIVGILAAVATLFLVIGFARYMTAGGDPSETERAKGAFKAAAIGYAGALLAPWLMSQLQNILGA